MAIFFMGAMEDLWHVDLAKQNKQSHIVYVKFKKMCVV